MFWTRSPRNFPSHFFSSLAFSLSLCVCFSSWENNAAAACFLRLFLIRLWWTVIGWNEKPKAFFISRCRPLLEFTLFLNISELKFFKKRNPEEMPTVSCGFTFYICFQPYRILEPSSRPPLEISSPYLLISGHEIHLLVCLSTEEKKKRKAQKFLWTRSPDRLTRGWAMIRHCLTSTQCRTCVHGAGLTAGFGRAPTLHSSAGVRVVQGLGKSLCDGVGKLSCFFCFFFCLCTCVSVLGAWASWVLSICQSWSKPAFLQFSCVWLSQCALSPSCFYGVLLSQSVACACTAVALLDVSDRPLKLTDSSAPYAAIHQAADLL